MTLKVESHQAAPGVLCIAVAGDIDMSNTDELSETIAAALLDSRLRTVHVDLGGATFLDAHGISTLSRSYNLAVEQRTRMHVVNARGTVRRVLQITDVLSLLSGQADPAQ